MRVVLSLVVACALLLSPAAAPADTGDRNAARALADSGLEAFEAGDYDKALERFVNAERIFHAPPHLLFIARCQVKLGRLLEAAEMYRKAVAEDLKRAPKVFKDAQDAAKQELPELEARIPTVAVVLLGEAEGVAVTLDGEELSETALGEPQLHDPGKVVIVVTVEGRDPIRRQITLAEGAAERVEIDLTPAPAQPQEEAEDSGDMLVPQLVMAGVGVAGLIVGAVTGGLALSDAGELKDRCPQNPCPWENESLKDSAYTLATVSTIGLAAGGALLAGAGLWILLMPPGAETDEQGQEQEPAATALGLRIGPASLSLEGRF